jgi:hypothetical protein
VLVRCACDKHKREGAHVVAFRVHDVGPWSRFDNFVDEARRPIVEAGQSDTYHRVPKRAPAIDLSPAAWKLLGHNPGGTRARQANYSGVVDLIVITAVVNPSADRARSARR